MASDQSFHSSSERSTITPDFQTPENVPRLVTSTIRRGRCIVLTGIPFFYGQNPAGSKRDTDFRSRTPILRVVQGCSGTVCRLDRSAAELKPSVNVNKLTRFTCDA